MPMELIALPRRRRRREPPAMRLKDDLRRGPRRVLRPASGAACALAVRTAAFIMAVHARICLRTSEFAARTYSLRSCASDAGSSAFMTSTSGTNARMVLCSSALLRMPRLKAACTSGGLNESSMRWKRPTRKAAARRTNWCALDVSCALRSRTARMRSSPSLRLPSPPGSSSRSVRSSCHAQSTTLASRLSDSSPKSVAMSS
mmetsp:Transcript_36294/g.94254  ORF Transcript_36294/g.94254 Transcript_36294/m.94254 type:complete len:202 (+) Transcript_36294:1633-2238(+)